jgi:hypothetical protein
VVWGSPRRIRHHRLPLSLLNSPSGLPPPTGMARMSRARRPPTWATSLATVSRSSLADRRTGGRMLLADVSMVVPSLS